LENEGFKGGGCRCYAYHSQGEYAVAERAADIIKADHGLVGE
jgi:hypothetical protein